MPINDWQFWVVSLATLLALYGVKRTLLPRKKGKRTNLTVSAKKHKNNRGGDCGCG